MPKNTELHILMFLSFLSGCFFAFWVFVVVTWNDIQKDLIGNLFSGSWYIIPIILAALMTICVFVGTIQLYLTIKKGV